MVGRAGAMWRASANAIAIVPEWSPPGGDGALKVLRFSQGGCGTSSWWEPDAGGGVNAEAS